MTVNEIITFPLKLRKLPKEFEEAALSGEATLDAARLSTVRLNSAAQELSNVIKAQIPDAIDSRRLLFYYLTKARVDRKTFKYNGKLKPITLDELSKKYKISRERVRQIENKAFEKLQKHMLNSARSKNLLPAN
mgnify:CR=1 FL=1